MTLQQDGRERWAVVLGASSGFGGAVGKGWARAGFDIVGVHLDMRGTIASANDVRDEIAATGVQVVFHNVNAADDEQAGCRGGRDLGPVRGAPGGGRGALCRRHAALPRLRRHAPYITRGARPQELSRKQMEMTADVMAHSLLYWVRDLYHAGLLGNGSRVYAMSSEGAILAVPTYGAVSAPPRRPSRRTSGSSPWSSADAGITVNAIRAGVTDTPALRRIPGWEQLVQAERGVATPTAAPGGPRTSRTPWSPWPRRSRTG